jgi:hypothetical protein
MKNQVKRYTIIYTITMESKMAEIKLMENDTLCRFNRMRGTYTHEEFVKILMHNYEESIVTLTPLEEPVKKTRRKKEA